MEGLAPVYYTDSRLSIPLRTLGKKYWSASDPSPGGVDNPYIDKKANGYRLPTSGEWQFAASCGGIYPYDNASGADAPFSATTPGKDIDSDGVVRYTDDVAVHSTESPSAIAKVGTKAQNRWGLYDMSGNAKEWVFDWYEYRPSDSTKTNYSGPTKAGDSRTVRGGGDSSYRGNDLRLGHTEAYISTLEDSLIGFRLCRTE
jgi:formylglycine-generating enzyme required for sulfatase activity